MLIKLVLWLNLIDFVLISHFSQVTSEVEIIEEKVNREILIGHLVETFETNIEEPRN